MSPGDLERRSAPDAPDARSGVDESGEWTPAFPGQRPPFGPGHALSTKHGVFSRAAMQPRAAELAAQILEALGVVLGAVASVLDESLVWTLAQTMAQLEAANEYVASTGVVTEDGKPAPLLKHIGTMTNTVARLTDRLAMNVQSRSEIGLNLAQAGDELQRYLAQRRQPSEGST